MRTILSSTIRGNRQQLDAALVFFPRSLLLGIACLALLAQTATGAGSEKSETRSDQHPDLSGTYDTATLTPLVRPEQYGDRQSLTVEEAEAFTQRWLDNLARDSTPSDPNRDAPPEGGVGIYVPEFEGAAGKVGGYNAFYVDIGDNTFQIDGKYRTSIIVEPENGRLPPLTEAGRRQRQEQSVFRHENTGTAWWLDLEVGPYDHPELRPLGERCILSRGRSGPPMLPAMYNNLKRIVQTEDSVVIVAEQMHDARIIPLNVDRDPEAPPKWMGDSVGRWEDNTLVVETTNFIESTGDPSMRRERRVEERFRRLDDQTLLYRFTVWDPLLEEPWTGEQPWPATDHKMYEYACHEGNYSFPGILGGARLLEREAKQLDR
jgi:hypothetical protein